MTDVGGRDRQGWPDRKFWIRFIGSFSVGLVISFAVLAAWLVTMPEAQRSPMLEYWSRVELRTPTLNSAPLFLAPITVQLHVISAVVALVVGGIIFSLPKGTRLHKFVGWSWVMMMIIVAGTSVAMVVDLDTGFNALHAFTAITVISLWSGLTGIRRGDVRGHAGSMVGLYLGGLILAGVFAFIPGRVMWQTFFGG